MRRNKIHGLGVIVALVGFLLYFLTVFDFQIANLLDFLSAESLPAELSNHALFGMGFGSSVMIGWGITTIALSQNYTKLAKNYLLGALITWYLLDGIASIITQFYLNVLSNSVFLLIGLWAILTTKTTD